MTATLVYHECGSVSIKQFSGSTYYADIDCTGQHIAPAGQSAWHRENQFRITFPAAHDYTKDWSYAGVGRGGHHAGDGQQHRDLRRYDQGLG